MRARTRFPLVVLGLGLGLGACRPDDVKDDSAAFEADADTDSDTDSDTDTDADMSLAGDWVSQGDDLSPLFADAGFTRIDATFSTDGSYVVEAFYGAGSFELTGTYTVSTATNPATISLSQASPTVASAEGIWAVSGGVLTYEVVQVDPNPDGYTPPTVEGGFGSTAGPGLSSGDNIQIFRTP